MIRQQVGGGTIHIWRSRRRDIQQDRITGMYRIEIIWEVNRSTGETGMEAQQKTPLRASGQGNQTISGGGQQPGPML